MDPRLRPAVPADLDAIARLHVDVWRRTYRDLAPAAAYRTLDETARRATWARILAAGDEDRPTIVAERDGAVVGFAHGGPPGDAAYGARGEVKYLYVASAMARRGIGRALLVRLAALLASRGYRSIGLGVVVGNGPALAFYRALGGRVVARYRDPGPLWRSENQLVVWDDIADLASRDASRPPG